MKVNFKKSEVVIFTNLNQQPADVEIGTDIFRSKHCMKVLGVMFDGKLT